MNKDLWEEEDQKNIQMYSSLLDKHGTSHKTLNWGSRESQNLRFKVLSGIGIKSGSSVLDVGCGIGDLFAWFRDQTLDVNYTGIDIASDLIGEAKKRFPEGRFATHNLLKNSLREKFDYVFASGIFAVRASGGDEYLHTMLKQLYLYCTKGMAFNILSTWSQYPLDAEDYAADPAKLWKFCSSLTPWTVIRHDYHPNDCSFYLYTERNR